MEVIVPDARRALADSAITTVLLLAFAVPALAVDGVLEINQACAVNTGCSTGDTAGFPVTISTSGSYRLTSNLESNAPAIDMIDVTTDDDAGIRTLLEAAGQHQIDMSVEGLLANDSLLEQIVSGTLFIQELTIKFPFTFTTTQATIVGDFRFNNFESSGEYQDAITFSATLQSTGTFTFTAAV